MKKRIILIVFLYVVLLLSSCDYNALLQESTHSETTSETPVETMTTTTSIKDENTSTNATVEVITTTETTTETTSRPLEETTTIESDLTEETTYETLPDLFERLMEFPSGKGYFYGKADIRKSTNLAEEEIGVHFRVVGFDHDYRGMVGSYYYVQIIETYGEDKFADQLTTFTKVEIDPIDRNQIYKMHWRGHLDDHLYGRPPLQIGEDYFRYITWDDHENGIFTMGLVMDIEEIDGKQYLYGYGIDMSVWDCAEKITDYEENQIYKVGQHDKVIAYLNGIGKSLPTFDYRCELFEWMDEVGIYTKE